MNSVQRFVQLLDTDRETDGAKRRKGAAGRIHRWRSLAKVAGSRRPRSGSNVRTRLGEDILIAIQRRSCTKLFFRHELSNQGRFSSRVREPTRTRLTTYPNQFRIGRLSQNKIFTMHKNGASFAWSMMRLFISCLVANSSVFSSAWLCGRTCPG